MLLRSSALTHAGRRRLEHERRSQRKVVTSSTRWIVAACVTRWKDCKLAVLATERFQMSIEPEGWHVDAGPPSWDAEAKKFSFFLRKPGREPVLCILALDALENAAQSSDLSEPALNRIFDAHRQMIELRAAQKLNAGVFDSNGSVLVGADDI